MQRLALTILAPDRPGVVRDLSRTVAECGGNWLESRMATLAGRFAGILLVEVEPSDAARLTDALNALDGFSVVVQAADDEGPAAQGQRVGLTVLGTDRPGIVRAITGLLANADINVEALESARRDAPVSGGQIFEASAELTVPSTTSLDAVQSEIEAIAVDLIVTWRRDG